MRTVLDPGLFTELRAESLDSHSYLLGYFMGRQPLNVADHDPSITDFDALRLQEQMLFTEHHFWRGVCDSRAMIRKHKNRAYHYPYFLLEWDEPALAEFVDFLLAADKAFGSRAGIAPFELDASESRQLRAAISTGRVAAIGALAQKIVNLVYQDRFGDARHHDVVNWILAEWRSREKRLSEDPDVDASGLPKLVARRGPGRSREL